MIVCGPKIPSTATGVYGFWARYPSDTVRTELTTAVAADAGDAPTARVANDTQAATDNPTALNAMAPDAPSAELSTRPRYDVSAATRQLALGMDSP